MGNEEIWRSVVSPIDLMGRYEISNFGRLKRVGYATKIAKKWKPDLILKISTSGRYMKIGLKNNGSVHNLSIHRLVCLAFHPNTDNRPQVNHINGIKHDNRAVNLEWATQSENIKHAQSIGLMKYAKPKPLKGNRGRVKGGGGVSKPVIDTSTGIVYKSAKEVSENTGIKFRRLRRSLSGERYNRTNFRYFVNGVINNNVLLPPPPKIKVEKPKFIRPPKKIYIPHPRETKEVVMFDLSGNELKVFKSSREASEFIGTNILTFRKWIRSTRTGFHKGNIFKYKNR